MLPDLEESIDSQSAALEETQQSRKR